MDGLSLSALHATKLGRAVTSAHGPVVGVKWSAQLVGGSRDGCASHPSMVQQWAWYRQAKLSLHGTGVSLGALHATTRGRIVAGDHRPVTSVI